MFAEHVKQKFGLLKLVIITSCPTPMCVRECAGLRDQDAQRQKEVWIILPLTVFVLLSDAVLPHLLLAKT